MLALIWSHDLMFNIAFGRTCVWVDPWLGANRPLIHMNQVLMRPLSRLDIAIDLPQHVPWQAHWHGIWQTWQIWQLECSLVRIRLNGFEWYIISPNQNESCLWAHKKDGFAQYQFVPNHPCSFGNEVRRESTLMSNLVQQTLEKGFI